MANFRTGRQGMYELVGSGQGPPHSAEESSPLIAEGHTYVRALCLCTRTTQARPSAFVHGMWSVAARSSIDRRLAYLLFFFSNMNDSPMARAARCFLSNASASPSRIGPWYSVWPINTNPRKEPPDRFRKRISPAATFRNGSFFVS